MDNVTHTLIGIAAAELFIANRPKNRPQARISLWLASALGNNLPDLDVVFTWGRHSDRLDYLLHHRGHTHTLLLAPLQGLLLLGILWLFWRRKIDVPWKPISILCFLGPLLHLFADSWNTYGVHPFWPWNNRWFYGDLVFIIEPWLWIALLPLVWKRAGSLAGKSLAGLLLGLIISVSWLHPFMQKAPAFAVTLGAIAWLAAQFRIVDDRKRIYGALLLCASVFSFFGLAQGALRPRFQSLGTEVSVLSHPANPFCATVFTAGFEGDQYRATLWTAATWPSLVPASSCVTFNEKTTSANLQPIPGAMENASAVPLGEFLSTRKEFERLAQSCRGHAFLRFARIPFWFQEKGQDYFGDLRFDRDRAVSFAEIPVAAEMGCPRFEPPWEGRFLPKL